jgi:methylated-DNA-[protein]-cysteine S-methyltransferase
LSQNRRLSTTRYDVAELSPTPIGPIGLAVSALGLAYVELDGLADLKQSLDGWIESENQPALLVDSMQQIREYLLGQRKVFSMPLDLQGRTAFTLLVLEACRSIPYGQVCSYSQLALRAGHPKAARAAGSVMAGNPIPLVIPCHRVVGSEGGLHGFGAPGGLDTKAWLLQMEGVNVVGHKLA